MGVHTWAMQKKQQGTDYSFVWIFFLHNWHTCTIVEPNSFNFIGTIQYDLC